MNLLLLPGNSKRSGEWLAQVELTLDPLFERTQRHSYAHWENDEPEIDLTRETERLTTSTQGLTPYVLFAKSAGTILTSKAIAEGILRPEACLFAGFPLIMVRDHDLPATEWLETSTMPITILQHSADPFGSYREVQHYFDSIGRSNVTVHELPGETHDYLEFQILKDFAEPLARLA